MSASRDETTGARLAHERVFERRVEYVFSAALRPHRIMWHCHSRECDHNFHWNMWMAVQPEHIARRGPCLVVQSHHRPHAELLLLKKQAGASSTSGPSSSLAAQSWMRIVRPGRGAEVGLGGPVAGEGGGLDGPVAGEGGGVKGSRGLRRGCVGVGDGPSHVVWS